jgi:hypothetical protein
MLSVSAQALHAALHRSIYSVLTGSALGTLEGNLCSFEKFRVENKRFVITDDPSVGLQGTTPLPLHGFS